MELAQDLLTKATALQVLACGTRLLRLPQAPFVVGRGAPEQLQQPLPPPTALRLFWVLLLALQLDPAAVGQQLERGA